MLEFVVEGNSAQMNDAAFVDELRHWIRFSPEQAMATKHGLFSACSGHPALPGWLGILAFDLAFNEKSENGKYRDHIRSSAGIAVFIGDEEGPEHWIKVGRSFQRFALQATALGIRNAHINQPIEVPAIRKESASWLAAVTPDRISSFALAMHGHCQCRCVDLWIKSSSGPRREPGHDTNRLVMHGKGIAWFRRDHMTIGAHHLTHVPLEEFRRKRLSIGQKANRRADNEDSER